MIDLRHFQAGKTSSCDRKRRKKKEIARKRRSNQNWRQMKQERNRRLGSSFRRVAEYHLQVLILSSGLFVLCHMDSWGLNCIEGNMTNSQRRGLDLDLDLNYPIAPQIRALDLSLGLSIYANSEEVQAQVHGWSHRQTTNVIEVLDDEVAIISPRAFSRARENSERNHSHGMREVIGEATGAVTGCTAVTTLCTNCKRRIPDDCEPCLNPGTSNKKKANNVSLMEDVLQPVSMPDESIFSCPVCMGPFIEPTATRQKVGKRGIFRVYLPTNN
ncbi:uncharacterized protein LOC110610721 isoform X2 [Manihot esculenta]|uniref:Uncharacterized protein n=2 Tax=Manihot esculenta TaxID=3983 RepID=A0A251LAQ4_MANES|nr:uncharacterized protein LOC110610721 isoform X2 [Manihot esculenta]XP_021606468.1 uncharacterized protein LOC110610721 isoform X2 [Manihot esculenta]OAY55322.1 hypothetical protein MANES_03G145300v8 [Manihot esculenta]